VNLALLQEAVQWLQTGRAEEAEARLSAFLTSAPGHAEALHLRGLARSRLGRFDEGEADLLAAAAVHDQAHAVLGNLGNLRRRAGRLEAAVEAYESALRKQPDFVDARVNLATTLKDAGRLEDARHAFEAALALQPAHPAALNGLGIVLTELGETDAAMQVFTQAVEGQGASVLPRINRGALLRGQNQPERSLTDLEQACQMSPRMAEAHFQRGHTLRTLGRVEEARDAYLQAAALAPLRTDIQFDLSGLLWEMGEGSGSTAVIDRVLAQQPDAGLFHTRARILLRTGQPEAALEASQRALDLDAGHIGARALRGELLGRLGQLPEGIADLEAALAATEGADFAIRHQLVEACLAAGRFEEAERTLDIVPPGPHLQKHVALQATVWRCLGDQRYTRLYDYDRLTAKRFIDTPPGFASLEDFNAALADSIARLHATRAQPLEQTLFGGTQSPGRLWDSDDPVINALAQALLSLAHQFVDSLPDEPDHPFLARKSPSLELTGAWSVRLKSGGGHVDHIHPAGWISASYYVQVPDSVLEGERAGWLRLGAPGIAGLDLPAERYILPEPGAAILFPSYMWHGVEPFQSDQERVTAPFDLLPA
jgi:tetratricopeptide (TPR) repeat protein